MTTFPDNIIQLFKTRLEYFLPDHEILDRPIQIGDPNFSVGLYCMGWRPVDGSEQIGQWEPALQRYPVRIQNLTKNTDKAEGRAAFTVDAKVIRAIVARDPELRVGLAALQEDLLDSRERVLRHKLVDQSYLNNELRGSFTFLATTDLWVETETVQL